MLTVGTILREPLGTTLKFVAWYLAQGADRIVLCFDDPADPAIEALEGVEGVECHRCTPAFWESLRIQPHARFTKRQNRAMEFVYRSVSEGWFLNVDSDELIWLDGRTLAEEAADQPAEVRGLTIRPAENIRPAIDTGQFHFRTPMPRWVMRNIYGDLAEAMQARSGLTGHSFGKSLTRAGFRGASVRQHWVTSVKGEVLSDRVIGRDEGAWLLHFFDQGYDVWRHKLPWRLSSRGFRGPMRDVIDSTMQDGDEAGLRAIYDAMYVFDEARLEKLRHGRSCLDLRLDFSAVLGQYLPGSAALAA